MQEAEVLFRSDVELSGSLVLPKGKEESERHPAILFLHGSGPVDRNENAKLGKINAFKLLTEEFIPHGFATLRYDKRGIGKSKGNYYEAGLSDLVADAEAALHFLKTHPNVDPNRIFLLGHSEGCSLAVLVQQRVAAHGLILLAGAAESLKVTITRQGEEIARDFGKMTGLKGVFMRLFKIANKIAKEQQALISRIERSTDPVIRVKGQRVPAKWMREHFNYNVLDDLSNITCPVLAISGSKDIQVRPEHAKVLAEKVSGEAEAYIIDNMNHLLRHQEEPANMVALKKAYKRSFKKPLETQLISHIVKWLKKNT